MNHLQAKTDNVSVTNLLDALRVNDLTLLVMGWKQQILRWGWWGVTILQREPFFAKLFSLHCYNSKRINLLPLFGVIQQMTNLHTDEI